MRAPYPIILVLALLAAGCGGIANEANDTKATTRTKDNPAWPTITADDNSYTVSMPARPTPHVLTQPAENGTITIHTHELATRHVNYTVGYSEYPDGHLAEMGKDDDAILTKATDATIEGNDATSVVIATGTFAGFPTRTISLDTTVHLEVGSTNKGTMRQVFVLAKGRIYITQTCVLAGAPAEESANAERFHKSLALNVK